MTAAPAENIKSAYTKDVVMEMSICTKPQLKAVAVRSLDRTKIINWTATITACKPSEFPIYD